MKKPFARALVTGGAGFIGSHLVDELLNRECEVIVLDDLSTGRAENVNARAELLIGDVGDKEALGSAISGCDYVFHLAAVSSVQESLARPSHVHSANLTATLSLLECAVLHRVKRFIFSSSAAVYGDTGGLPAREDMQTKPLSHYAVQKLSCEHYCSVYNRLHGLETVALRYFNVFGPRQRADSPYSGVVARFLEALEAGRDITIFGTGEQTRDFCFVDNVVSANIAASIADASSVTGLAFNIGSGTAISITQLAHALQNCYKSSEPLTYEGGRQGEILHSVADISLARAALGYSPISFEAGLIRFLG